MREKDIPGLTGTGGMFFEYYAFDPRSNFKEEDLGAILAFFDIVLAEDTPIPKSAQRHFQGKVFKPQRDITLNEFADILNIMGICYGDDILKRMPTSLQSHFDENNEFSPYDDFSLEDLLIYLSRVITFKLETHQFNTLPKNVKRQFIVCTRDGKSWRYGSRRPV
jgi:hypothetical protein